IRRFCLFSDERLSGERCFSHVPICDPRHEKYKTKNLHFKACIQELINTNVVIDSISHLSYLSQQASLTFTFPNTQDFFKMKLFTTFIAIFPLGLTLSIPEVRDLTTTTAAHRCKIIAGADVNCHYCDQLSCDVVKVLQNQQTYNFDCLCPNGETINNIGAWDHNPDYSCWVWANTTDYNCPTIGSNALPECSFCGK
ncbi:uncharacterized protein LY89DRAFT_85059, partial [Mollisia scopiformis]